MNNFHRGKKDAFFFWKEHAFGSVALEKWRRNREEDEAEDEVRQINRESQ